MTPKILLALASLALIAPVHGVYAQDNAEAHATSRTSDGGRQTVGPVVGQAVERSAPAPGRFVSRARAAEPPPTADSTRRRETGLMPPPISSPTPMAAEDQRRRGGGQGGRARGDNPVVGRAVPRQARPAPAPPIIRDGRNQPRFRSGAIYVPPRAYNYYYYPRQYYPYGYGAFGLGYFYYDPYVWYPPSYYPYYGGGYYGGFSDEGELRLSVIPRDADVYVDGYFAGRVDEFDGTFQSLKLQPGAHHIQIVAQGFAPLDFDVRIEPGRKTTYRGVLQPFRP